MMKNSKLISTVIPAYIRDAINLRYFEEALLSVLNQTYHYQEILVINDESPHARGLEELLEKYDDTRIIYHSKKNGGVASVLNMALTIMSGDVFSWLSHDDLFMPEKLEKQMALLESHDFEVIASCGVEHMDSDGRFLTIEEIPYVPDEHQRPYFARFGCYNACTHLIPRHCFDRAGRFDESLKTTQDNDMWFRIAKYYEFIRIPDVLLRYRNHPSQDSRSSIHLRECNELFISFLQNLDRNEILAAGIEDIAEYYALCASVRKNRGYQEAYEQAAGLAFKELLRDPIRSWKSKNYILGLILGSKMS